MNHRMAHTTGYEVDCVLQNGKAHSVQDPTRTSHEGNYGHVQARMPAGIHICTNSKPVD